MVRSVTDMTLPEVEEIVEHDAEMRQMLVDMSRRQAGGASKGGRYNKHDTARLRFIRDKALMGVRLGILVPESDMRMLRLEPQEQLRQRGGADWLAMEAWAEKHGRDPRSQKKDGSLDEAAQQTLLRWVVRNAARFHMPAGARRGRTAAYVLDFGAYQGYSLLKLIAHANKGGGHLLSNPDETTPPPGQYVLWLASTEVRSKHSTTFSFTLSPQQLISPSRLACTTASMIPAVPSPLVHTHVCTEAWRVAEPRCTCRVS
jgi:hypothetical protein